MKEHSSESGLISHTQLLTIASAMYMNYRQAMNF